MYVVIQITKGQVNTVYLTLKELTTLANPNYLFVFTNDTTYKQVKFICSYTVEAEYTVFDIEETNTPSVLEGKITLNPSGFWTYEVYEQSSTTNLNPALATGKVESGKVQVLGDTYAVSRYTNTTTTNEVYTNE